MKKLQSEKFKEMTEYLEKSIMESCPKNSYIGKPLDPEGYIRSANFMIKKFSESLNLPLDHFSVNSEPEDYLEYLETGKIGILMSDEAHARYKILMSNVETSE